MACVIMPMNSCKVQTHLEYCTQFWLLQLKKYIAKKGKKWNTENGIIKGL